MSDPFNKPQIGVSACLLGKAVRFDGGHVKNRFVVEECVKHFDLHSVCPEVEIGLSIPRPAIQLRKFGEEIKLVYSRDPHIELTEAMRGFSESRVDTFDYLDGYIFKSGSPSCGMERVAIVDDKTGVRQRNGMGVFAQQFKQRYPDVPTEEEGRLNDSCLRENFLERVYAHYRWRCLEHSDEPLQAFRDFHKNYKLMLMAKNAVAYRQLGRMVATVNRHNLAEIRKSYFSQFMQAMAKIPSRGNHINVLMHIQGYLKNNLNAKDKAELLEWYETYRHNKVNRITPLALLQHHFKHHPHAYMAEQYYFSPFPADLMQPI